MAPHNTDHTAVPIWSGFIYQGKAAMCYALQLLCDDKDCNYALQLDAVEDFTILASQDEIVSMHQVKAQARGTFSSYTDSAGKSAFEKLKEHAEDHSCPRAFFHLAHLITDKNISDIEDEFPPIKIYQYSNGSYECAPDQINSIIEDRIKRYFMQHCHPSQHGWKTEPAYLEKTRVHLCEIIEQKVLDIHAKGQQHPGTMSTVASREKIPFFLLSTILNDDLNYQDKIDKYYLYRARQDFRIYYEEFAKELVDEPDMMKKITGYMITIQNLDDYNIVKFIQHIMPHRLVKFDTLQEYKDSTLIRDEVRDAFFKILKELKETNFEEEKNVFIWELSGRKRYYPTTIIHGQSSDLEICKRIIENALNTDLGLMFEKDCLVTTDIDVESILEKAPNIIQLSDGAEIKRDDKRIMEWKKVSLVKLENVIREIND